MNAEDLFEAMRIISEKTLEEAKIDKTIVSSIESGPMTDGAYMVSYFTEKLKCYPQGPVKYSSGDVVRVLVPEGDFGKKKIILGLTSERTEDLSGELGSVIIGDGYNYLVTPRSWKLTTQRKEIEIDPKINSQLNERNITHIRIESEIFSDLLVQQGLDFGIRLNIKKKSGATATFELNRKQIQGNLGSLNGKKQSAIFEIGEEGMDAVSATGEYFSNSSDFNHISFTNSKIDLIDKDIANSIINGLYEVSIGMNNNQMIAKVENEEFGELDREGSLFNYSWFSVEYQEDGSKVLNKINNISSKTQSVISGKKFYEVLVEAPE